MQEEALVQNILQHQRLLKGMLTAMVGSRDVAEDLFQEVAMIMARKRGHIGEVRNFVAWARQIAINVVRDFRKRSARCPLRFLDPDAVECMSEVFEEVDAEEWKARMDALRECARKLPERSRQVLVKRYELGMDIESLSSETSMSRGAMDSLLYRIRGILAHCVNIRLLGSEAS
jgi:RNA polymerase sigma-70 factor (ECF subfamily)